MFTTYLLVGKFRFMDMKNKILQSAQRLIQERGVNGFSYADIAKEVGVSKPSLHHHYASKHVLIVSLMQVYTEQLVFHLESLSGKSATEQLQAYFDVYRRSLERQLACMGGMLSAEALTLGDDVQALLSEFFDYQRRWLTNLLEKGKSTGEFEFSNDSHELANLIVTTMQGSLIIARALDNKATFEENIGPILKLLSLK